MRIHIPTYNHNFTHTYDIRYVYIQTLLSIACCCHFFSQHSRSSALWIPLKRNRTWKKKHHLSIRSCHETNIIQVANSVYPLFVFFPVCFNLGWRWWAWGPVLQAFLVQLGSTWTTGWWLGHRHGDTWWQPSSLTALRFCPARAARLWGRLKSCLQSQEQATSRTPKQGKNLIELQSSSAGMWIDGFCDIAWAVCLCSHEFLPWNLKSSIYMLLEQLLSTRDRDRKRCCAWDVKQQGLYANVHI